MGRVNVDDIQTKLEECQDPDVADHFYSFGQFLLGEVQRQTEHLDTKLLLVMGWNVGLLAFVLIGQDGWLPLGQMIPWAAVVMIIALFVSLLSMIGSYLGAKPTDVEWPSEEDWLSEVLFDSPELAKRHYVMCMLSAHQRHQEMNAEKSVQLKSAVKLLLVAGCLVGGLSLFGLLLRLFLSDSFSGDLGGSPGG